MLPLQGAQVQSLVRELDPTSYNLGVHTPQLAELTRPCVAVKTWHSQINKINIFLTGLLTTSYLGFFFLTKEIFISP